VTPEAFTWVALALAAATLAACLLIAARLGRNRGQAQVETKLALIEQAVARAERAGREEAARAREEAAASARHLREEVARSVAALGDGQRRTLEGLAHVQRTQLADFANRLGEARNETARAAAELRQTVEARLDKLRAENAEKLEQMRQTVDEKLQGALEQRLNSSFALVSEQLKQVYESVGDMQRLAAGVGDLKRVLTNVRSRGTWGEVQLGALLEQALAADQYGRNVEIQPGSNLRVEFAIRQPSEGAACWLPIDAKFPIEDYERLLDAAERADPEALEQHGRALELRVREAAKSIRAKYIRPPHSTDFAILFLPTEGLFAEVLRRPGLSESLHRDLHVMVAGPSTLLALLMSFQVGFRNLALKQRASEVWQVLGAVKTEFAKFELAMEKVERKLEEAQNVVVDEVGRRRRAMDRRLRAVEALPEPEARQALELPALSLAPEEAGDAAE
jgi:DNA recombination protein RmuC